MGLGVGYRIGSLDTRDESEIEESVMDWLTQYEPQSWVPAAIVLAVLLLAIVLLPLTRLA
jgi:hypothetical protein